MSQKREFDLIVIGGGPGGYVAAIRASQLGLKTVIIEKGILGGVCLNHGCIPTKSLIRSAEVLSLVKRASSFGININELSYDYSSAVDRSRKIANRLRKGVEFLLKKMEIEIINGTGRFDSNNKIVVFDGKEETKEVITGKNVIIATGSRPKKIKGIEAVHKNVFTSNDVITLKDLPDRMVIIGGGAIGLEFAYILATYDVKITIIEAMEQILPGEDEEIANSLKKSLERIGIKVLTGIVLKGIDDGITVEIESREGKKKIETDSILLAAGREPNIEGIGLQDKGIELSEGCIKVGDGMNTGVTGIYAIGDCAGQPFLAHKAIAEGILAAENIAGRAEDRSIDRYSIPMCIYTNPQVAGIGMTEREAEKAGYTVKVGRFPLRANGKALAIGETEGFIKIVFNSESDKILGAQLIGPGVTELLGEIVLARKLKISSRELSRVIHPHPTLSETIMEAAGLISGVAIHS